MNEERVDKFRGYGFIACFLTALLAVLITPVIKSFFEPEPQTTKTLSMNVTDAELTSRNVCIIDTEAARYCTDVRRVEVKINPILPGTAAAVYTRTYKKAANYGNAYNETTVDWIVIFVRTEQQRKDYQAKINHTLKEYYGARDVKIRDKE